MAKTKTKTLLIGCGGSGLKTLMQLNGLLASNADVREDMAECVSYLVLDTDAGDLDNFTETVQHQMGDVTPPIVQAVHLTKNQTRVEKMAEPLKKLPADSDVTAMMKQYWWYSEEGRPFSGKEIKDLKAGAAQCPQVSFIAAWKNLPDLKLIVDSLLNQIQKNNTNEGNALSSLRVFIVAGLAGGTGRGSWTLVALKVRQCLLEHKVDVPIDSIFFDASCYPNPPQDQISNMFFNSATGISELSAWIRGKKFRALEGKPFRLPSLTSPKMDRTSDVINFDKVKGGPEDYVAPVDSAYVVFGKNGWTARLAEDKHYYEMAAAALYAKIVNDEEIARRDSNARSNIGSFASATFGVDSVRIQAYLETAVQKEFLKNQFAEPDAAMIQSVQESVGSGDVPDEKSFLGKNHLWVPADLTIKNNNDPFAAETSLLEAMLKLLEKGEESTFGSKPVPQKKNQSSAEETEFALTAKLREALGKDQVAPVKDVVKKLKLEDLTDNKVAGYLNKILAAANLDGANLAESLRNLVMEQFDKDGVLSLRRAMLYVENLTAAFSGYSEKLDETTQKKKVDDLIKAFNGEVDKASSKEVLGIIGDRFNKTEIKTLCKEFELKVREALLIRITAVLKTFFDAACEELGKIQSKLELMGELFEEASTSLNANLKQVFDKKPYDDIFDELFIDPTVDDAVLDSIPKANDVQLLYKRALKPIMSRAELTELLRDKNNYDPGNTKSIKKCITTALKDLLTGKYEDDDEVWEKIPPAISEVIVANVRLKTDPNGLSFIDRNFSFRKVLDDNMKELMELLRSIPVGKSGDLRDRLNRYLGLTPEDFKKGHSGALKVEDSKLVKGIVRSLMTVCKPWIEINTDTIPSLTCLVVLPLEEFKDYEADLNNEIREMYRVHGYDLQPTFLYPGPTVAKNIPRDRILVYTSELLGYEQADGAPVGKIQSLDYWQDYADLLKVAEDLDHNSAGLFEQNDRMYGAGNWGEKDRTFAFLAPLFTMEPYRDLRWHPWIDTEINREKEQLDEVYRVLFYALLGHALNEKGEPVPAQEARPVGSKGFTLPLLTMQNRGAGHAQSFVFLRNPLVKNSSGKMEAAYEPVWKQGSELANSIDNVVDFLNGQGRSGLRANRGADWQASMEEGNTIRLALAKEAEAFFEGIKLDIGRSDYEKLVGDCRKWLFEQSQIKGKDQKFWQEVLAVARAEMEKIKE